LLREAADCTGSYTRNENAVSDLEILHIFANALNNSDCFVANESTWLNGWYMPLSPNPKSAIFPSIQLQHFWNKHSYTDWVLRTSREDYGRTCMMWRSDPQIVVCVSFITASLGSSTLGWGRSSNAIFTTPLNTSALVVWEAAVLCFRSYWRS